jgi:hypothetical protein
MDLVLVIENVCCLPIKKMPRNALVLFVEAIVLPMSVKLRYYATDCMNI